MDVHEMIAWIVSGDTGISSKTIWAALMGVPYTTYDGRPADDIPYDTGDFGRCYRLVKRCDITKDELKEVVAVHKDWKPIIDNWDKLCSLYENNEDCYDLLDSLEKEVFKLRGLVEIRKGWWVDKDSALAIYNKDKKGK